MNPRATLDRQLRELNDEVLLLGSMVEEALLTSTRALRAGDLNTSREVYASDQRINEKRLEIETYAITVISTQQPVARDMRILASILEIITELERIGDYAKGIGRINLLLNQHKPANTAGAGVPDDLVEMAQLATDMLHRALGAFVADDVKTARAIPAEDDKVDTIYNRLHRKLIERMTQDSASIDYNNYLLWAAHNLERTADRVTNICERTVFVNTGKMIEMDPFEHHE